uniref:Twinfilin n=1 Tax=Culicoides sonorensis TaxID=179676 RepID=A0A336KE01_CULSO
MSHQTGIKEELTLVDHKPVQKTWSMDYDKTIKPLIKPDIPCYILYRLDEKTPLGYAWLLLSWVPDTASIRDKMLYASTKATLKIEFGSAHIKEELHATILEETTFDGYQKHKKAFAAPAPLTSREEELEEMRRYEVKADISVDSKQQTLGGVVFPITEAASKGLRDMARGSYTYLQFRIEISEEKIHLVKAGNLEVNQLAKEVPEDHARYHLFLFKHTHEGDYQEAYVFIYTMPGYTCSVKERMMYSSCKGPFLDTIHHHGITVAKKIEVDSGSELTEEFLQEEVHPKKILHRPAFAKPKGPANRGPKRLTKPTTPE